MSKFLYIVAFVSCGFLIASYLPPIKKAENKSEMFLNPTQLEDSNVYSMDIVQYVWLDGFRVGQECYEQGFVIPEDGPK